MTVAELGGKGLAIGPRPGLSIWRLVQNHGAALSTDSTKDVTISDSMFVDNKAMVRLSSTGSEYMPACGRDCRSAGPALQATVDHAVRQCMAGLGA